MKKFITILVIIVIIIVVFLILGPFYIVEEGEQSVLTRFGKIVDTQTEAGLKFKMPMVDNVTIFPKKILSWDGEAQRIPTEENQFIWVDTTARWEISDPNKFYESVTTLSQAYARLDDVVDSAVRTIISRNPLYEAVRNSNVINEIERESTVEAQAGPQTDEVDLEEISEMTETVRTYDSVRKGRISLSSEIFDEASGITPQYGIELIDVVIRQIRYSDDLTESVYERMIKDRNQIAQAFRSYGQGRKAEWLGRLDKEKRSVLSEAYEKSEELKGTADAEATRIYSEAYSKDRQFFELWRSLESYRNILPTFKKTLTTDMDYFKYLYTPEGEQ